MLDAAGSGFTCYCVIESRIWVLSSGHVVAKWNCHGNETGMWNRTLHLEEMLLLPKSPLLFLVCSFLSCFVLRDPHGRQRGRLQARTDAPSVEDARCRTRKLGFPGSCFEGGGCRKHGFPVSCGFRETSMAYAGQEQRGAVMSLAEAGGAPTTRGVLTRISSSHGPTMLSSFPVEGEALLLVWDVSFQEVLRSRHRQGYVTVDCFDIRVLETLKVGVLRCSGIFLASTSSWAWAWHVFRVGISPHLVPSPVSQYLPRRPSGNRVFDRKMPLWNNVAPPLCFDSCLLFPRARPKNQWSNVCTKLPTPLPTPLRLLTSRPASPEHASECCRPVAWPVEAGGIPGEIPQTLPRPGHVARLRSYPPTRRRRREISHSRPVRRLGQL